MAAEPHREAGQYENSVREQLKSSVLDFSIEHGQVRSIGLGGDPADRPPLPEVPDATAAEPHREAGQLERHNCAPRHGCRNTAAQNVKENLDPFARR